MKGDGCDHAGYFENRLGHVVPVIDVFLKDVRGCGKGRCLGTDDVTLATRRC